MAHVHVLDLAGVCTGPGPCDTKSLDRSSKSNWVEKAGGLDPYVKAIANALVRSGHSRSQAIQLAWGTVRNWAEGKGNVSAATRARAAKAVANMEAKRARAHSLSATDEGVDLAAKKKPKVDPNANKAALDAQQAQFLKQSGQSSGDFNSKHPRAGAGSATGGQFITAGSSGDEARGTEAAIGAKQDGVIDSSDVAKIKQFQADHGLQVDGVVGAQTADQIRQGTDKSSPYYQKTTQAAGALNSSDRQLLRENSNRFKNSKGSRKAEDGSTVSYSARSRSVDLAARTDLLRRAAAAHRAGNLSPKHQQMVRTYLTRIRKGTA